MIESRIRAFYDDTSIQGELPSPDATLVAGSESQGEMGKITVGLKDDVIIDAKFQAFGCPYTIAAVGFLANWLKGKTLSQASEFDFRELLQALDFPETKKHAALLAQDMVKNAFTNP